MIKQAGIGRDGVQKFEVSIFGMKHPSYVDFDEAVHLDESYRSMARLLALVLSIFGGTLWWMYG